MRRGKQNRGWLAAFHLTINGHQGVALTCVTITLPTPKPRQGQDIEEQQRFVIYHPHFQTGRGYCADTQMGRNLPHVRSKAQGVAQALRGDPRLPGAADFGHDPFQSLLHEGCLCVLTCARPPWSLDSSPSSLLSLSPPPTSPPPLPTSPSPAHIALRSQAAGLSLPCSPQPGAPGCPGKCAKWFRGFSRQGFVCTHSSKGMKEGWNPTAKNDSKSICAARPPCLCSWPLKWMWVWMSLAPLPEWIGI